MAANAGEAIRSTAPIGSGISQTAFVFAVLATAFLIFVTLRGDLPKWLGLFGIGKPVTAPAAPGSMGSLPDLNSPAPNSAPGNAPPGSYGPNVIPLPQLGTAPVGN